MPRICARSAHDLAVCAPSEEMDKEELANFRFSTKTGSCTTVCILIRKGGARLQQTTTRTRDGDTVFLNVSF